MRLDRRDFLRTAAGGLLIGFSLPSRVRADAVASKLNAYVHVSADDFVTLFIHKAEMGQGTVTSLSMLLAEELECDWKKIRTEFPGVSREYGPFQGVVGSASIRSSWDSLPKAGATARLMLIEAAAKRWGVDSSACRAENNSVINTASGAKLRARRARPRATRRLGLRNGPGPPELAYLTHRGREDPARLASRLRRRPDHHGADPSPSTR